MSSGAYADALRRLVPELGIWSQACPLLVPLIEEGWLDDPVTAEVAWRYLEPLLAHDIDTLVLGCTHYPLIASLIARIAGTGDDDDRRALIARLAGERVALVDSAAAVSDQVATELAHRGLLAVARQPDSAAAPAADSADAGSAGDHFCVTDSSQRFERIAGAFLGRKVALELVDIGNSAAGSGQVAPERS